MKLKKPVILSLTLESCIYRFRNKFGMTCICRKSALVEQRFNSVYIFDMQKILVVYENDEIFLINKPAGVSVQGGEGVAHPLDVEFSRQAGFKVHLVHRLDKETCGLMIVAKTAAAASKWIKMISSKLVQKEYTAVCFGEPEINGKKRVSGTIRSNVEKKGAELAAETHFEILEKKKIVAEYEKKDGNGNSVSRSAEFTLSKLRLTLGTGRMHQIRIHLASVGCPIAGDDKHGDFKLNKLARKALKIKNLLLCSRKITIPLGGDARTFEIPLPGYFDFF